MIDVTPLQEAFARSGMTPLELARAAGVKRDRGRKYCSDQVMRDLGLRPTHVRGRRYFRESIGERVARRYAGPLGLDPVDLGC